MPSSNGGHLRPEPGAALYFFVRPIPTLQSTEPATARAHRTPRACFRPIGNGGAMSWRRRWPTHGGRGPKPLEGRAAAAHVGCCVVVVWLCCGWHTLSTHFVEKITQPMVIFSPSLMQELMQNCSPQAALTNQHTIRIRQRILKLGWQLGLAIVLRGKNMHFLCTSVRYSGRIGS